MHYKSHQYKGNRINPLSVTISLVIALLWLASGQSHQDNTYTAQQPIVKASSTIEKITHYFPKSHNTIIAIAHAESNMNPQAQNWNCYYNKTNTIVYTSRVKGSHSTACKKDHRKYAWSTDCGILQVNYKGKICPTKTIDEHLQEASTLSKHQGLKAWTAYNNQSYKQYLK